MAYNKVIYNGETLIDLTSDTITANKMYLGYTAHSKNGSVINGTLSKASVSNGKLILNFPVSQ